MANQLERMDEFFERRLDGYEEHMLTCIESAEEFYPFTASCLPEVAGAEILDLGCGTGLELDYVYRRNPAAKVTGIDLSAGMLDALREKFRDKEITLIRASYFDVPLGEETFDAAVSVESLHHFTQAAKIPLYSRLCRALKPGGYFILTDYFAESPEAEVFYQAELRRMKAEQSLAEEEFYHYDTPLTVEHETDALLAAGFARVEVLGSWANTYLLKAYK